MHENDLTLALQEAARAGLLDAVHESGFAAQGMHDAWAQLVAVQAEIALDAGGGAKSTTAAKFVAGAAGLPLVVEPDRPRFVFPISEALAIEIVALLEKSVQARDAAHVRWRKQKDA